MVRMLTEIQTNHTHLSDVTSGLKISSTQMHMNNSVLCVQWRTFQHQKALVISVLSECLEWGFWLTLPAVTIHASPGRASHQTWLIGEIFNCQLERNRSGEAMSQNEQCGQCLVRNKKMWNHKLLDTEKRTLCVTRHAVGGDATTTNNSIQSKLF